MSDTSYPPGSNMSDKEATVADDEALVGIEGDEFAEFDNPVLTATPNVYIRPDGTYYYDDGSSVFEIMPTIGRLLGERLDLAPQGTQMWLDIRKKYLTCSNVASTLGVNKYCSLNQLIDKKTGHGPVFQGNYMTRHGQAHEDEAIMKYEAKTGRKVFDYGLVAHPVHSKWLAGSPDGLTNDGRLIEVKCPV
jgi:putative phage-type endonuclease